MKLAILFWFYRHPELCRERLEELRRFNPGVPIYGLYGGNPANAAAYEAALGPLLDDWWAYHEPHAERWKWRHGDMMIAAWFRDRGRHLDWDSVFVAQWDMAVFESVRRLVGSLKPDELLLSGLRPAAEVEGWWCWTAEPDYPRFMQHMREAEGYDGPALCCQFVGVCLPRSFLARFAGRAEPELGFLEYTIPTLAAAWGHGFCREHRLEVLWPRQGGRLANVLRTFSASGHVQVPDFVVAANLRLPNGRRIFHPVRRSLARRRPFLADLVGHLRLRPDRYPE